MRKLTAAVLVLLLLSFCFSGCGKDGAVDDTPDDTQQTDIEPVKAQVINILEYTGTVTVVSGGVSIPAYDGFRLAVGDRLSTGSDSNALLDLNNGGTVIVDNNSELEITQSTEDYIEVELLAGRIINNIETGNGEYAVKANNVTMGVLGTIFIVDLNGGTAKIDLYEGGVTLTFAGNDGVENSFKLEPGLSFSGSDEAIEKSLETGELETEECDYRELSNEELELISELLGERVDSADDSDLLTELIDKLGDEMERRRQPQVPYTPPAAAPIVTPPSAPPVPPVPPVLPNPEFGALSGALSISPGTGMSDALTVTWSVQAGTQPFVFGYRWSNSELNPDPDPSNPNLFEYNDATYMIGTGTSAIGYSLSDYWGKPGSPTSAPLMLHAVMVSTDLTNVTVYDTTSITIMPWSPLIVYTGGKCNNVFVSPPIHDISAYTTSDGAISVPVSSAVTNIDENDAITLIREELTLYPNGEQNGCVVTTPALTPVDGFGPLGDANLNIYLPTIMESREP